jgi:hypothetical protein
LIFQVLKDYQSVMRMVLISTDLCLNLNELSRIFTITAPDLTRLILVNSGRVYWGFNGKGWPEMIYQWRLQNIIKIAIVLITSINQSRNRSSFTEHTAQKKLNSNFGIVNFFRLAMVKDNCYRT